MTDTASLPTTILNLNRFTSEVSLAASVMRREMEEAHVAIQLLLDRTPLAAHFPDGNPAPEVLSPRQVMFLASLVEKGHRG